MWKRLSPKRRKANPAAFFSRHFGGNGNSLNQSKTNQENER
jgi:hypothetical protein